MCTGRQTQGHICTEGKTRDTYTGETDQRHIFRDRRRDIESQNPTEIPYPTGRVFLSRLTAAITCDKRDRLCLGVKNFSHLAIGRLIGAIERGGSCLAHKLSEFWTLVINTNSTGTQTYYILEHKHRKLTPSQIPPKKLATSRMSGTLTRGRSGLAHNPSEICILSIDTYSNGTQTFEILRHNLRNLTPIEDQQTTPRKQGPALESEFSAQTHTQIAQKHSRI